jgi:arsenate reductase (thioredoxin)
MSTRPVVLFVCVHNAGRSRMAEAFLEHLAGDRYAAASAGTEPADAPHPEVVAAMKERGIPLRLGPGRMLTRPLAEGALRVVGMGCAVEEACPALTTPLEDWGLEDPRGRAPREVAEIRDQIERRVKRLVIELDEELSSVSDRAPTRRS